MLYGFLEPVRVFLEERSNVQIPIESMQDVGTGGGFRSLRSEEVDFAAASARYAQRIPEDLRAAGKLVLEIAIGFDETALFVRRDNPMRRIEISAIRDQLCCDRGQNRAAPTWAALGLDGSALARAHVAWTAFGRTAPPQPNDSTSSTILQADAWLCSPRQLCASERAGDVAADEVLARRVTGPEVLALSTRAFATEAVVPLAVVDSQHRTHLDGRKVLWLYVALVRARAMPARLCRFLDAVLAPTLAGQLVQRGKAHGLPDSARLRQRAALGLDDGSCSTQPIAQRASPADDLGISRSPAAEEIEIQERWVVDE